jgi:hypothetical protein
MVVLNTEPDLTAVQPMRKPPIAEETFHEHDVTNLLGPKMNKTTLQEEVPAADEKTVMLQMAHALEDLDPAPVEFNPLEVSKQLIHEEVSHAKIAPAKLA